MSDELPAAAQLAGVDALVRVARAGPLAATAFIELARAVLLAATERRTCRECRGHGDYLVQGTDASVLSTPAVGELPRIVKCESCAGSGFLYVLKQDAIKEDGVA